MRQSKFTALLSVFIILILVFQFSLFAKTDEVTEVTLENGIRVIIKEIHTSPIVAFTLWYQVGSKNELPGITGISHVCEHMMFKGTPTMSRDEMMEMVYGNGGYFNAGTGNDMTVYFEIMPKNKLDVAMRIESDRMANATMAEEDFTSEIIVIQNERRQTLEDSPTGLWDEEVDAVAFLHSPYHWSVVGWMSDLKGMKFSDVQNYYKTYYTPNNSFIVIAGDIKTDEAIQLVKKYFGEIPKGPEVPKVRTEEPEQNSLRIVERYSDKTNLPVLTYRYHIPEFGCDEHAPLLVLGQILSSGRTSRLEKAFVETKLASSASGYADMRKLPGLFTFSINLLPDIEMQQIEQVLRDEVQKISAEPVTDQELQKAKNRALSSKIYGQEGIMNQAFTLGSYELYKSYTFRDEELEAIQKVTTDDLMQVAQKYLRPNNLTIGRLFPEQKETKTGSATVDQTQTLQTLQSPEELLSTMFGKMNFYFPPDKDKASSITDIKMNPLKPRIKEKKLSNGLTLVVLENDILPIVSIAGNIKAGGVYDPHDKMGLASLTATMLRRGTKNKTYDEINEALEFVNASVEMYAGLEDAGFSARCLKKDLNLTVSMLSDILRNPSFPADGFEVEKQQYIASAKRRAKNARIQASQAFREIIFKDHPYSKQSSGTEETLANINLDDCQTFWSQYYRPGSTILVMVGDITLSEAEKLVKNQFGDWDNATQSPDLKIPEVAEFTGKEKKIVTMMEKAQGDVFFGFEGIKNANPDLVPLQVVNYIFGGSTLSSRLGKNLRVKHGWTYGATSSFNTMEKGGYWTATVRTAKATIDSCIENIQYELNRFFGEPPTDEEINLAKNYLIGSTFRALDTNGQIANAVLNMKANGFGYDYYDTYAEKISKVDAAEIDRLMKKYMDYKKSNILVIAGPVESE